MQTRRRRKHATMRRRCQHSATSADAYSDRVNGLCFDDVERAALCELLEQLGPDAPTTLAPWTTRDIAVHLYMREHDALASWPRTRAAGPLVSARRTPSPTRTRQDFSQVVAAVRSGPRGLFRLRWTSTQPQRDVFIHHEDVRRANGGGPRAFDPAMDRALWSNVKDRRSVDPHPSATSLRAGTAQRLDTGDVPGSARNGSGPCRRRTRRAPPLPVRATRGRPRRTRRTAEFLGTRPDRQTRPVQEAANTKAQSPWQ